MEDRGDNSHSNRPLRPGLAGMTRALNRANTGLIAPTAADVAELLEPARNMEPGRHADSAPASITTSSRTADHEAISAPVDSGAAGASLPGPPLSAAVNGEQGAPEDTSQDGLKTSAFLNARIVSEESALMKEEPVSLVAEESLQELLIHAVECRASDITLQTGHQAWLEIAGRNYRATKRAIAHHELQAVASILYSDAARGRLAQGHSIDYGYEIRRPRQGVSYRFRVNITRCIRGSEEAIQITLRTIPSIPPRLEDLPGGVEDGILENLYPRQGLVLVNGPTGSGKSTLMAAAIRSRIEDPSASEKILTYEAPVEQNLAIIVGKASYVAQHRVPEDVLSFADGVRNAMRRKPSLIMIGESRDPETISACAEASLTGHLTYSSMHVNGVAEIPGRILSMFSSGNRSVVADIMESLSIVITQQLLPSRDGGRRAVREFLVFNDAIRGEILSQPAEKWSAIVRKFLQSDGQPIMKPVQDLYDRGEISEEIYHRYKRRQTGGRS